jgi:NAD+ kinase
MNDGEPLVGVVGDATGDLEAAVAATGARPRAGDVESVLAASPALFVAVGDAAFARLARSGPAPPVLPVDVARGFRSVPAESVAAALDTALAGDAETQSYPILRVEYDGERVASAVADVSLLTAEVAHISEYAVGSRDSHVGQFRADGVVVATPAGSPGYARRLGCPVVAPGTGVGPVAPIAPFATDPDHWVLALEDLRLTVERDETPVTLVADDREVATVAAGEPVTVSPDQSVDVALTPASDPEF